MCKHIGVQMWKTVKKKWKMEKKNLLNINLRCGCGDGGHGCEDALHTDADWLANECKESKKQQRKKTHWWTQMVNAGVWSTCVACGHVTCWHSDTLHVDRCDACGQE